MIKIDLPAARVAQIALSLGAFAFCVWLFLAAGQAMTPFLAGLLLAYLLLPAVNMLARSMKRGSAILLVYAIGFAALAALLILVVPTLLNQLHRLATVMTDRPTLQRWLAGIIERYRGLTPDALEPQVTQAITDAIPSIQASLPAIARSVFAFLVGGITQVFQSLAFLLGFLITPIFLFYVLQDERRWMLLLNRWLTVRARPDFWNGARIIERALGNYVRGELILSLIVSVAIGVGLLALNFAPGFRIDYILLLAIWAGLCKLVPLIGGVFGTIPAVLVALALGGLPSGLAVLALYVFLILFENNVLGPRITGEKLGVHPAALMVALIAFGSVFGLPGVILAAPLTAILRDAYLYTYRRLGGMSAPDAMRSLAAE